MENKKKFRKQKIFLLCILILLITSLFLITIIKAENNATPSDTPSPIIDGEIDPATGLPKEVIPIQKIGDTISDEDRRTAYLKAEWQKILEKSEFWGPIVRFIKRLDPVSNILLGMPIAFSGYFFLTLVIWIAFVVVIIRITYLFEISQSWLHWLVALGLIAAITYFRYPKSISGIMVALIILQKIWWVQYIIIGIVIIFVIFAIFFSKELEAIWKKIKEKHNKNLEELKKDEFRNDAKLLETFRKEMAK